MKQYLISLFLLFMMSCSHEETTLSDQGRDLMDPKIAAIEELLKSWDTNQTPGAAIGIVEQGKLTFSKGFGLANLEHEIPNTTQTTFNIASNSKQFTAACISILVTRGDLNLSQDIHEFFPDFPSYFNKITIDHLLHHTSGIRDFSQITYLSGLRSDDYYNDEDISQWLRSQKELNFQPGEQYLYSNSGYWLLGQIVGKVSGMSLGEFARQEIFIPLNMSNAQFIDNNTRVVKNRAYGYSRNRSGGYRHIYSMLEHTGNGGMYATVNDLKKWDDEFYNHSILKDEFWKIMTTTGVLNSGETLPYAKGLILDEHKGLKVMDHGGRAPGYRSNVVRFPKERLTVILLTNTPQIDANRLCYDIADTYLEGKLENPDRETPNSYKVTQLPNKQLETFSGSYWSTKNAISRKVTLTNDTLRYERGRGRNHALLPIGPTQFKMLGTPEGMDVTVQFSAEDNKRIMMFIENGKKVDTWERYRPISYASQELAAFAGKYYSEEIDTNYEIKIENETAPFLYINDNRTVPMQPVMDKLFSSPMGIFRFQKGKNGKIVSLRVSTPRVKNLRFIRLPS